MLSEIYDTGYEHHEVAIRCPRCGKAATFRRAFTLLSPLNKQHKEQIATAREDPGVEVTRWGGWTVIVHFPGIIPWEKPAMPFQNDVGMCACSFCGYSDKHRLSWPDDAYFQCVVGGHTLWAWNREHAAVLKRFIESGDRNASHYPHSQFLMHIPEVFLLAKHRDEVSRKLERLLALRD